MADEKIIDRIRKLLAMAADSSSPHEAAIAAGRARKMMDQHQVSLGDLDSDGGLIARGAGDEYRFMPAWQGSLSIAVAKLNDCKVIKQHKWQSSNKSYSYQLVFQGYENDVMCAIALYDYLVEAVKTLCHKYIKKLGYTKYPAKIGDAFKKSCVSEIYSRIIKLCEERTSDPSLQLAGKPGTSLVLYKMQKVEEMFGEAKYVKGRAIKIRDNSVLDAAIAGSVAGRTVDIHRKIQE